jgi:hypothetical protein
MTDMTSAVQKPGYLGVLPTYTPCTAADKFTAAPNSRYMLHYKNGATAQASGSSPNRITNVANTANPPPGAAAPANWADAVTSAGTGLGATTEGVVWIDNTTPFRDSSGFVNMVHPGTLTTLTVAIFGPF